MPLSCAIRVGWHSEKASSPAKMSATDVVRATPLERRISADPHAGDRAATTPAASSRARQRLMLPRHHGRSQRRGGGAASCHCSQCTSAALDRRTYGRRARASGQKRIGADRVRGSMRTAPALDPQGGGRSLGGIVATSSVAPSRSRPRIAGNPMPPLAISEAIAGRGGKQHPASRTLVRLECQRLVDRRLHHGAEELDGLHDLVVGQGADARAAGRSGRA